MVTCIPWQVHTFPLLTGKGIRVASTNPAVAADRETMRMTSPHTDCSSFIWYFPPFSFSWPLICSSFGPEVTCYFQAAKTRKCTLLNHPSKWTLSLCCIACTEEVSLLKLIPCTTQTAHASWPMFITTSHLSHLIPKVKTTLQLVQITTNSFLAEQLI